MYRPFFEINDCLLLDSLHIKKLARGKGIGKALLYKIGGYAYENGYCKMYICYVKGNEKAEKIYKYLGAEHYKDFIDDFEGTPSNSTILLWKDLGMFRSDYGGD